MSASGLIALQFSRQYDVSSAVIAWAGAGRFSHVDALNMADGSLTGARSDKIGLKPAGVQTRPAGYARWKYVSVLTLDVSVAQQQAFYTFIGSQIGKPYDTPDIVDIAFGGRDRDWRADSAWICSELITVGLEKARVFKPALVSASKVAPNPLYFACSVLGFSQDA